MKYFELWLNDKLSKKSFDLKKAIKIEGLRDKHLGPRLEYAKVCFLIEPANSFEVSINDELIKNEYTKQLIDASIYGFIDIIMTTEHYILKNIMIKIIDIEIDEINSSVIAFRNAGREAGNILLKELNLSRI